LKADCKVSPTNSFAQQFITADMIAYKVNVV